jgi:hypothetical protein
MVFAEWFGLVAGVLAVAAVFSGLRMLRRWRQEDRELADLLAKAAPYRFLYTHPDGRQEWMVSVPREERR